MNALRRAVQRYCFGGIPRAQSALTRRAATSLDERGYWGRAVVPGTSRGMGETDAIHRQKVPAWRLVSGRHTSSHAPAPRTRQSPPWQEQGTATVDRDTDDSAVETGGARRPLRTLNSTSQPVRSRTLPGHRSRITWVAAADVAVVRCRVRADATHGAGHVRSPPGPVGAGISVSEGERAGRRRLRWRFRWR